MEDINLNQPNSTNSFLTNEMVNVDSFTLDSSSKNFLKFKQRSPYCDENSHFICKICKSIPELDFISLGNANYSCACDEINNMPINKIVEYNCRRRR